MSPLGGEPAVKTLKRFGIRYHLQEVVPQAKQPTGWGRLMEAMAADKEPEGFYQIMKKCSTREINRPE